MAKKRKKKSRTPKLRAWGIPSRKVATMVIPSKKEKGKSRRRLKKELEKEIRETESLLKDSD